jgi:hypothetical protein
MANVQCLMPDEKCRNNWRGPQIRLVFLRNPAFRLSLLSDRISA